MAENINIAGRLHSTATGNVVAGADEILYEPTGGTPKKQSDINQETDAALTERYTKSETYNKTQVNQLVSPQHNYIIVETYADLANISEHPEGCVYRVSNYDGTNSQVDATMYSEYGWDGTQYIHLATKSQIGEVFDISAYHATGGTLATYTDLTDALTGTNGGVPQSLQKGGMSVKFVHSYDNKYVEYFLRHTLSNASTAAADFANEASWEKSNIEKDITFNTTGEVNPATVAEIATWNYGYIKPDGTIQTASSGSWKYSGKIPIVQDSDIIIRNMYCNSAVTSLASYDENNTLIPECSISQSSSISFSNPVTINTSGYNVAYIRITYGGGYDGYNITITQITGVETIKQKVSDIEQDISDIEQEISDIGIGVQWDGKSWVALGTSITDTNNTLAPDETPTGKFVPYLVSLSGLVVTNKGVAGSVIGGHILYYAGHTSQTANAALVTIEGGVNDWAGDRPLGNVGDTVPYLVEWTSPSWNNGGSVDGTFAGACYQAIKIAMDNSPKAVVVVLTDNTGQHVPSTGAHCEREQRNNLGLLQKDYTDMLIAVANYMGVPVINAGQKSMINQNNTEYLIDQIHQTELGGEQYANVIWSELKNIPNRVIGD